MPAQAQPAAFDKARVRSGLRGVRARIIDQSMQQNKEQVAGSFDEVVLCRVC